MGGTSGSSRRSTSTASTTASSTGSTNRRSEPRGDARYRGSFTSPIIQVGYAGICTRKVGLPRQAFSATIRRPRPGKESSCARCMWLFSMRSCRSRSRRASASERSTCSRAWQTGTASRSSATATPIPRRPPQADEAFRDLGIATVVVDRAVPTKSGPGFYAAPRGQSPLPAALLGGVTTPAQRSPMRCEHWHATRTWMCGIASGLRTPRCCATRLGMNWMRRAGR